MAGIDEILQAISAGVAKINDAIPAFSQTKSDSETVASSLAQLGAESTSRHMETATTRLGDAQRHLAAAIQAATEASHSVQAAKEDTGLPTGAGSAPEPDTPRHTATHPAHRRPASFGSTPSNDYKKTFFDKHPTAEGHVWVHHAVEQQTQKRYPGLVSDPEMHSYENLRGMPKGDINRRVHLSAIRKSWNRFYKKHPNPTKQQLLDHATSLDNMYGAQFNPPIR